MKECMFIIDCQLGMLNDYNKSFPSMFNNALNKENEHRQYDYYIQSLYANDTSTPCYRDGWKKCMTDSDDYNSFISNDFKLDKTFVKNTYSSCTPEVFEYFKANNITTVYLCGISTNCCVLATAFELYDKGFKVYLLEDMCTASSKDKQMAGITTFKACFGEESVVTNERSNSIDNNIEKIKQILNRYPDYSPCVWNINGHCITKQQCAACKSNYISNLSEFSHLCRIDDTTDKLWKALLNCTTIKTRSDIDSLKDAYAQLRRIDNRYYLEGYGYSDNLTYSVESILNSIINEDDNCDDTSVYNTVFNNCINNYIDGLTQDYIVSYLF